MSRYLAFSLLLTMLFFTACQSISQSNLAFEKDLMNRNCSEESFNEFSKKIAENKDVIYTGLNAGSLAKACKEYKKSNDYLDAAEKSYKEDVDLEGTGKVVAKAVASTITNESFFDYQGDLYERIMVNVYKGLNFMALDDFALARVEFNRALLRQDKAKDYFQKQIEANKKELEEAKKDENYEKNVLGNMKTINQNYSHLFEEFDAAKNFTNPYATYLASVFFFLDKDFKRAAGLYREVAIVYKKDKSLQKVNKLFQSAAKSVKGAKKKYIFLVYEDGLGMIKEEFKLTLPFLLPLSDKASLLSIALPILKPREPSFGSVIINGQSSSLVANFDTIRATEFKKQLPMIITKAILSTLVKAGINTAVAKNDPTGGYLSLASTIFTTLTTTADTRSWRALPKSASTAVIENKGRASIKGLNGTLIAELEVSKNKNVLILVRSFMPGLPANIYIIEK